MNPAPLRADLDCLLLSENGIKCDWKCTNCGWSGQWVLVNLEGTEQVDGEEVKTIATYCSQCRHEAVRIYDN